jgi:RNA polymerase sigma factor FliA
MSTVDPQYPPDLAKVIRHAKRLMKVLAKMERSRRDVWFVGRDTELRGIVSLALADWRSGTTDTETAGTAIVSYVDAIHRDASKKLRCGVVLECCEFDDVITAVGPNEWGSMVGSDTTGTGATLVTSGPTRPAAWEDSPGVLARVEAGLPLVEMHARRIARRLGDRCATMDDLRAFGHQGLLDAARAFDEGRGVSFDRWASLRVRNAMVDGVRRFGAALPGPQRRRHGVEAAHAAPTAARRRDRSDGGEAHEPFETPGLARLSANLIGVPTDVEVVADSPGAGPEELLDRARFVLLVRELVAELPDQERALIEQNYFNGLSVEQAAASIGVTRSWAHRMHARAIESLNRKLRGRINARGKAWRKRGS